MSIVTHEPPRSSSGPVATERRVLGVDVGLLRTGYAFLSDQVGNPAVQLCEAGVVRISREITLERRLLELEDGLSTLIREQRPTLLACEELYAHYKHPRTAIRMAHARGVVLVLAARSGLEVVNINATQVKKMLTGNGHAGKPQMQRAIAAMLGLSALPEPNDVADALAIALSGLRLHDAARRTRANGETRA